RKARLNVLIIKSKKIYTPLRVIDGYIKMNNGIIEEVSAGSLDVDDTEEIIDYGDNLILPGFIDLHTHGFATGSFTHEQTDESVTEMSKSLAAVGVTSFLPTTGADAISTIQNMLDEANKAINDWTPSTGSEILGIHLEGPFINKKYKGMQKEEHCIDPSIDVFHEMIDPVSIDQIKLMTLAPELPGALPLIKYLNKKGIQISIGHSAATFDEIKEIKDYGIGGVTHMFSGMKGFHHRELGVAGSALYFDDLFCEFSKQTGLTVFPEALDIAVRIKTLDRITLCTDTVGLAHIKEPTYHYIRQITFVPDGDYVILEHDDGTKERLDKKSIDDMMNIEVGYLESVQNLMRNNNMDFSDIMKIASENTAKYINVYDKKGSIEVNKDADIIVLDHDANLVQTYVQGVSQL